MNLKKYILTTLATATLATATIFSASSALALDSTENAPLSPPKISANLHGFAHFQAGYRNQSKLTAAEKPVSHYKDNFALFNEAALIAHISNKANEDLSYGAKIIINTKDRGKNSNAYNGTHIYMVTEYGKIELGSPVSPVSTMLVDASCITSGSGSDPRYANTASLYQQFNGVSPTFATSLDFFLSDKLQADIANRPYSKEPPRSIVFYTPRFDVGSVKTRIGIAYTPDSSNTGASNTVSAQTSGLEIKKVSSATIDRFEFDNSVKDAVSGGISMQYNFADGVDLNVGLSGEYGKSVGFAKEFSTTPSSDPVQTYKLADLKSYNIGAVFTYGNFSYAGSYGSLGKSLTTTAYHKAGRKTNYYTTAAAYQQGPCSVSVDYYRTEQFKNVAQSWGLGTNYTAFEGLTPYIEVQRYTLSGKPEFYADLSNKTVSGTVIISGLKLKL